jgi:putative DNA primase/helicase
MALPTIVITDCQLRDLTETALGALRAANDPPVLFERGDRLTRVRVGRRQIPSLETLSEAALRGRLGRVANWYRKNQTGHLVAVHPPTPVVRDILALPELVGFPPLDRLVEAPVYAEDGTLLTTPGYHRDARVWFQAPTGFDIPPVNPNPSLTEVEGGPRLHS